jgi:pyruvate dehydrogenase E1 component beta subunit
MFGGLKVVYPSTAYDAKGLLKTSIRDDNPVIFIEHQLLYTDKGPVPVEEYTIPLGVAAKRKEGKDVTLVSYGGMMPPSLRAAEMAEAEGVSVEVIDLRTLIPLDVEMVADSVGKTGRLLLVTQAPEIGCFCEHVTYEITRRCFDSLKAAPRIVAAHNVPPPMAQTLEQENIPQPEKIQRALVELVRG